MSGGDLSVNWEDFTDAELAELNGYTGDVDDAEWQIARVKGLELAASGGGKLSRAAQTFLDMEYSICRRAAARKAGGAE